MAFWSKDIFKPLRKSLGKTKLLTTPESLALYGFDATGYRGEPNAVVMAETTEDVLATVEFAAGLGIAVTARGAGSGLSGGSVPIEGGIVLSCERMKNIESLDTEKRVVIVQPGVVTTTVQEDAARYNLFYPPDPSSHTVSTIGGNVAENAGGLRCLKYGVTSHYVLGIEFVNSEAQLVETGALGGGVFEPDLTGLLIGSEGTLGIFTRIALRLIPTPETAAVMIAYYREASAAFASVEEVLVQGLVPSVMEFMDAKTLSAVSGHAKVEVPAGAQAALLVELDGAREEVERVIPQAHLILSNAAMEVKTASTRTEREHLWTLRRSISPSLNKLSTGRIHEDVAVPRGNLSAMAARVSAIADRHGLDCAVYGHAGDGNLHVVLLYDASSRTAASRAQTASAEIFKAAIELDGTITGEHGVGCAKIDFLPWQQSEAVLQMAKQIKKLMDPHGMFNPGKIFTAVRATDA